MSHGNIIVAPPKRTSIVLGLFFGDEGKGLTTSYLAQDANSLVIRFNGGHQAGHTVVKDDVRHIFSNFGSGTLNGAATYWSQFCTFYPFSFCNERESLIEKGVVPEFYIHPLAPITTPWDIVFNRTHEKNNKHGSVGEGFGSTIKRHEETHYKLYAQDLLHKDIFEFKLEQIRKYYYRKYALIVDNISLRNYLDAANNIRNSEYIRVCLLNRIKHKFDNFVFEGAQGIMLDQDFGFFPHVTRSNTTCKNALQICNETPLPTPEIYYVMRSYLTRHGNGPMPGEMKIKLDNNENETNVSHEWQGEFRTGYHSYSLLSYSLDSDDLFSHGLNKNLVITCLDQTTAKVKMEKEEIDVSALIKSILFFGFSKFFISDNGKKLQKINTPPTINANVAH